MFLDARLYDTYLFVCWISKDTVVMGVVGGGSPVSAETGVSLFIATPYNSNTTFITRKAHPQVQIAHLHVQYDVGTTLMVEVRRYSAKRGTVG